MRRPSFTPTSLGDEDFALLEALGMTRQLPFPRLQGRRSVDRPDPRDAHRSGGFGGPPDLRRSGSRLLTFRHGRHRPAVASTGRPAAGRAPSSPRSPRIALLGNPNTGKTTLFNRLCGVLSKTANFPGTTTRARVGRCQAGEQALEVVDLPGVYRLALGLPESQVCRAALQGEGSRRPDLAVVVLDATNLARNLVLLAELADMGVPAVAALNMVDLAQRRGLTFDVARLSALLGCPVVPVVARRGDGLAELRETLLASSWDSARTPASVAGDSQPPRPCRLPLATRSGRTAWWRTASAAGAPSARRSTR